MVAMIAATAWAGGAEAQEWVFIKDSNYRIDAVATPVLGSARVVGLAGAYTALAEGIDAVPFNPAGYAARAAYEHEWYEYEISGGLQLAGAFTDVDYFLNGKGAGLGDVSGFYGYNAAGRLQFGQFGLGGSIQGETFQVRTSDTEGIDVDFTTIRFGGGYNLLDGQLAIGVGARYLNMSIDEPPEEKGEIGETLVSFEGVGLEAGAVLRLANRRWRVGLMASTPVDARVLDENSEPIEQEGSSRVAGYYLPRAVNVPWEIRAGFAWQFLERQFNPRFAPPKNVARGVERRLKARWCEREREQALLELGPGASPGPVGDCPRLTRRPQDPEWWAAERRRRQQERLDAQTEVERANEEVGELWDTMEASRARRYLLVSADLRLLGPTELGKGVDAFASQNPYAVRGEHVSVGVHVGAEAEPWTNRMKVRCGIYWEPARYADVVGRLEVRGRLHGTLGFDFRVIDLFGVALRAGFYVDGARDWVNWGVSIGGWH